MSNLENLIKQALASDNVADVVNGLETSLANDGVGEHELAWALGVVFEKNITEAFRFIPTFLERYPQSLHPVRVFYSDLLARQGQYDLATDEARFYLRCLSDSKLIDDLQGKPILQDGVARAWLLLSAVYTEVGARSYSKRVVEAGLKCSLPSSWVETFNKELSQLDDELQSSEVKALDEKWERFFTASDEWEYLDNCCQEKKFPLLQKRIELLKDNFKFNPSFNLNDEMLKVVTQSNGAFTLV
ncbi:hypothetical protein [Amphritea pacifica]|uniref:Tetratricopeptide repeat protein n=1 Tax=Amphritea pacifica TaxID=2811233 RepID=A0ABS2WDY7_9GAMM|nr:hypothetical protein [Amphritea pacifica]MBN0989831.1 hypothetical protein [Amphritea pacifica]